MRKTTRVNYTACAIDYCGIFFLIIFPCLIANRNGVRALIFIPRQMTDGDRTILLTILSRLITDGDCIVLLTTLPRQMTKRERASAGRRTNRNFV